MTQAGTRSATPSAVPRFTRLEAVDPADVARDRGIDPTAYLPDMDVTDSPVLDELLARAAAFDFDAATEADVRAALAADRLSPEGFGARCRRLPPSRCWRSWPPPPAARGRRWFGGNRGPRSRRCTLRTTATTTACTAASTATTTYVAPVSTARASPPSSTPSRRGLEEILLLTGEDRERTDPAYIGEACKLAAERFRMVGVEVYPMNEDEYAYLHGCGVDYVTVFQETYDPCALRQAAPGGARSGCSRTRANAQERAMRGGMRGAAFGALLGLGDFRRDAYACGRHAWLVQRAYPHAELSLWCPRCCVPSPGTGRCGPRGVGERQLLQVMCAYLFFRRRRRASPSRRASARASATGPWASPPRRYRPACPPGRRRACGRIACGRRPVRDRRRPRRGAGARRVLRGVGLEPVMNDDVFRPVSPRRARRFGACSSPTASAALSRCRSRRRSSRQVGHRRGRPAREGPRRCRLRAPRSGDGRPSARAAASPSSRTRTWRRRAGLGCAAVHLPLPLLRAQSRPDGFAWVGTNVHEADEVAEAEVLGADVLVASPVFAPSCKPASTARGLPFLRAVLDGAPSPVFALGGITDENERLIREAGAAGSVPHGGVRASSRRSGRAAPCKYERSRG